MPTVKTRLRKHNHVILMMMSKAERNTQHPFDIYFKISETLHESHEQLHPFCDVTLETHSNRQEEQPEDEQRRHLCMLLQQNHFLGWMPICSLPHSVRGGSQMLLGTGAQDVFTR